jgi:hypothetical protein
MDYGKKVFFLFPPSVVKDELVFRLLEQEYEVYMLRDVVAAKRLLALYPDSLLFVNIDEGMSESEWEMWILGVQAEPAMSGVGIGILTYNANDALRRKYLMDVGAKCGLIHMKLGIDESTRLLLATLNANEAKGRRRYVRADCSSDKLSSVNLRHDGKVTSGTIKDISVVGFSGVFTPDPRFAKNTLVSDIQLRMRGALLSVNAIVFGTREQDGSSAYVFLFSPPLFGDSRTKIRRYVQIALQADIELKAKV